MFHVFTSETKECFSGASLPRPRALSSHKGMSLHLCWWVTSPGTERCSLGFSPTLESIWSKLHFWTFLDCILEFLDNLRTQPVPVGWSHHPWESNWRQSRRGILGSSSGQLQCMGSPAWLSLLSLLSMGAEDSTRHNSRVLSLG